jgi:hypothetical protein
MLELLIVLLSIVMLIGGYAIARETSLFGPRHGFLINWQDHPWRSFETVCAYITTALLILIAIKWIIGLFL